MTILGRAKYTRLQINIPKLGHVINHDEIGVQVDNPLNLLGQKIGEVHSRVIQRLVKRTSNRVRDFAAHNLRIEVVERESKVRKRGRDRTAEI